MQKRYYIVLFFIVFQLVIGYMYRNNCPIEPAIPYYLIVAGVIELITTISSVLLVIYSCLVVQHNDREYDGVTARFAMWIVSSVCIHLLLVIFLFIWLILGCIWVFSVSHSVQYNDPSQQTYCHPTLYRFAYFVLVISIIWKVNNYVTQFYKNYNARS